MFGRRPAPDAQLQASALEQAAPVYPFVRIEYQRRGAQNVHGFYPVQTWEKRRRGRINFCASNTKDVAHNTSMDFIPFKRSEKR